MSSRLRLVVHISASRKAARNDMLDFLENYKGFPKVFPQQMRVEDEVNRHKFMSQDDTKEKFMGLDIDEVVCHHGASVPFDVRQPIPARSRRALTEPGSRARASRMADSAASNCPR